MSTIKIMAKCLFISILATVNPIFVIKIVKFCYFNYENLNNVIIFAVGIEKTDTP